VCATPVESIAEYVPGWSRWRATCSLRGVGTRTRAWLGDTWRWIRALPELDSALAGVAGGAAMAAYLVLAMWGAAEGPLAALRAIGSGHPLGGGVLAGTLMHFVTAAFWGIRLGELLRYAPPRFRGGRAALGLGALWGVALWVLMGLVIGPLFSPSIARTDPVHYVVSHLVYGITSTALLSAWLRHRRRDATRLRRGEHRLRLSGAGWRRQPASPIMASRWQSSRESRGRAVGL
jgi:hypothetical protein